MMRRFELSDGTSNKFWEIEQDDSNLHVCYGRIGTAGSSQCKSHADPAKAGAAMDKLIREKTGKGYIETTSGAASAGAPAVPVPVPHPVPPPAPAAVTPAPPTGDIAPWLAAGPLIDMPAGFAAQAMPSRRFPGPPPNADADACWTLFIAHALPYAGIDSANSDEPWRGAVDEAAQRVAKNSRNGSAFSDLVLLALSTRFEHKLKPSDGAPFLDFLVAEEGLLYAVEVLLNMEKVSIREENSRHGRCWYVTDDERGSFSATDDDFGTTELALRAHLAHAPQQEWERCVAMIREALPSLSVRRQPLLGLLLPDVPELSDELALTLAPQQYSSAGWLRLTATAPASLLVLDPFVADAGTYGNSYFYDLPAAVATAVQERGVDAVDVLRPGAGVDAAGEALVRIGTPGAIQALALACDFNKKSLKRLASAAQRWPYAALAGLSELAAANKDAPPPAKAVLAGMVMDHAAALPALKAWISPQAAKVLDDLCARFAAPLDMADLAELPSVLSAPPWMAPPKMAAKPLVLAPLPLAPVERWTAEERAALLKEKRFNVYPHTWKQFDAPGDSAAAVATGDVAAVVDVWEQYHMGGYYIGGSVHAIIDLPAPFNAAVWTAMAKYEINSPGRAIATMGLDSLPGLAIMCERRPADELPYAMVFGAVELAGPVARAYTGLKARSARELARRWLLANPEHAACGLIAPALGKAGAARDAASRALRMLAASGHEALLMEVAGRYQQDVVNAAMRAMLDEDPLDLYPAKIAPLPAFWMPRNWTRPALAANGKVVPDAALDPIGVMLRFPQTDGVYAGITQMHQAFTPGSLAGFAWDLFNAWLDAGADAKENWAYGALRVFGNDDIARKLTPLIRAWPGESQHARAVAGLDILAAIGTDTALMLLNGIAQKVKFKALQDNAREKIGQIAEARNLTTEELEDRLAPDLGLDDDGALLLDFGARQFKVGFDETLKPYVRDADGARLADLPKPKKTDDADLSAAAVERYKLLKKDARTIATQQVLRLELAMCAQRRWQPEVFRDFLAGHPLLRHLVQRLVWGAYEVDQGASYGGRLVGCFRIGPDGESSNADDDAFELPESENIRIGIPHALDLPASEAAAFGQLFADYELLQPFPQIGRDTYALTAAELASKKLMRWDGVVVPTGRVLGLANKGWRRGRPRDGGWIGDFNKTLDADRLVSLSLDPGMGVGMVDEHANQTLKEVLVGRPAAWGDIDKPDALSTLDPIAVSELIRDIQTLCA